MERKTEEEKGRKKRHVLGVDGGHSQEIGDRDIIEILLALCAHLPF